MRFARTFKTCLFFCLLGGLGSAAQAGDLFEVSESKSESYIDVGAGVLMRSPYVGSETSDVSVLPFVNAEYKGRFYLKPAQGAGVYLINKDKFRLGTGANVALGRDAKDVPAIGAAGVLDNSLTGNVNARVLLPFAALDMVGTVPLGGDIEGARVDVAMTTQLSLTDTIRITPGVRATYMTGEWMDTYYGLTPTQAAVAKTTPLSFGSGFSTLGVHGAVYWTLSDSVELIGAVNYSILVGDVKNSILTPDNNSQTAAIGIARKF